MKSRLHDMLLDRLNLSVVEKVEPTELRREIAGLVSTVLAEENNPVRSEEFNRIVDELIDEVMGFGPLEPLLADPTIDDILVNGHKNVFVERFGVLERSTTRFRDEKHLLRIIDKIVSRIGRRVDESQPWVDARLEDQGGPVRKPVLRHGEHPQDGTAEVQGPQQLDVARRGPAAGLPRLRTAVRQATGVAVG